MIVLFTLFQTHKTRPQIPIKHICKEISFQPNDLLLSSTEVIFKLKIQARQSVIDVFYHL